MPPPYSTIPVTAPITPLPNTTFGAAFDNMTETNFSILHVPRNVITPYTWTTMGSFAIPTFILLLFIYLGLWIGQGNVRIASISGLLIGGMLMFSWGGLGLSIPIEMVGIAYGALIASIAGLVMSIFKTT